MDAGALTRGYDLRTAWSSVWALMADPSDPAPVFRIINALPGESFARTAARIRQDPASAHLLRDKRSLAEALCDHEALRKLPEGTLGASFVTWCERENIDTNDLIDTDARVGWAERSSVDADIAWVRTWYRDMHDLWHIVTGYDTDLLGEPSLVALQAVQARSPGHAFIASMVFANGGLFPGMRGAILDAVRRARRIAWLPGVDWFAMLPLPLDEVRRRVRVDTLPGYTRLRLSDMPGGKLPEPPLARLFSRSKADRS